MIDGLSAVAPAQQTPAASTSPEVFAKVALGRLFRIEDRSFGNEPSIGGSAGLRFGSRVGVEFEVNQVLGLTLEPAPCGVVIPPCVGTARSGARSARVASANLLYYFGGPGSQLCGIVCQSAFSAEAVGSWGAYPVSLLPSLSHCGAEGTAFHGARNRAAFRCCCINCERSAGSGGCEGHLSGTLNLAAAACLYGIHNIRFATG